MVAATDQERTCTFEGWKDAMEAFDGPDNKGPCRSEWGRSDAAECAKFMKDFQSNPGRPESIFQCFPERALLRDACAQVEVDTCTSDDAVAKTCGSAEADAPPMLPMAGVCKNTLQAPTACISAEKAKIHACPNGLSYAICEAKNQDGVPTPQYFTVIPGEAVPGESKGMCEWSGPRDLLDDDESETTCDAIYRTETPLSFPCGYGGGDSGSTDPNSASPDWLANTGYGLVGLGLAGGLFTLHRSYKWLGDLDRSVVRPLVTSIARPIGSVVGGAASLPGRATERMYNGLVAGAGSGLVDPMLNIAPDLDRYGQSTGQLLASMIRGLAAEAINSTTRLITLGTVGADGVPVRAIRDLALARRTWNRQRQMRTFLDNVERTAFSADYDPDNPMNHSSERRQRYSLILGDYTDGDERVQLMKLIRDYNLSPKYPYTADHTERIINDIVTACGPDNCGIDQRTFTTLKSTLESQLSATAPDRWNNIAAYAVDGDVGESDGLSPGIRTLCGGASQDCRRLNGAVKKSINTHLVAPIYAVGTAADDLRHATLKALVPGYDGALLGSISPTMRDINFVGQTTARVQSLANAEMLFSTLEQDNYTVAKNMTGLDGYDWDRRQRSLNDARDHAYRMAVDNNQQEQDATRRAQMWRRMRLMDQKLNHLDTALLSPLTVRRWTLRALDPDLAWTLPRIQQARDFASHPKVPVHPLNQAGVERWGDDWYKSDVSAERAMRPPAAELGGSE